MSPELPQVTEKDEVIISPERKRQIRADLAYFQLFAFQGPRITTGDRERPLDQLNEENVKYEYTSFKKDEWGDNAVAMTNYGLIGGQQTGDSRVSRLYPLVVPVFPKASISDLDSKTLLAERRGLIVLETMLDNGGVSVLMAGYANYERIRHNCPVPTGFELVFSDLGAANRFFENLRNNPTATVNEYVLAAIGGVDGGKHAAFGGKWPSDLRYLGVRRYNDEMFQAEVTSGGVKVIKRFNIDELARDMEEKEAKKPVAPPLQLSKKPPLPPGHYRGESKIVIPRRPEGYFSLVAKHKSSSYDDLNMEAQRNAPPPNQEFVAAVESRRPIIDSSVGTDVGKVREHNEDVARIFENLAELSKRGIDGLYIVADGMGGHAAGEVASSIAADVMAQQCLKQEFPRQDQGFDRLSPDEKNKASLALQEKQKQWLVKAVGQANRAVFNRRQEDRIDMGTTLVVAIRSGDQVAVANVGDSRAYMISGDGRIIRQITEDHSLVARLVATQQITAEEAKVHPQRNVIYRTIGGKPRLDVDVFFAKIPKGGSLVLCSDGLSGMVNESRIGRIVVSASDSKQAVSGLIDAANAAGGDDNISAIVVRNVVESPKEQKSWETTIQELLNSPIARTAYSRTGSLSAAAVAYEHRAAISSGKITKEQYTVLLTRVLSAGKI